MKIFLIRHGESLDDVEDCYGGVADFPLTEAGRKNTEELAHALADSGIELVFSSPYQRARDVAKVLAKAVGCKVAVIEDLSDRNSYGVMTAVNKDKAKKLFAYFLDDFKHLPGDYDSDEQIPGAESREIFDPRVKRAFEEAIAQAADHKVIAIITHANLVRSIYRNILNVEDTVELDLLAFTEIEYSPSKAQVLKEQGVEVKK